jgi:ABC-type branched-subunit amino acid transport system substrate-binding protein
MRSLIALFLTAAAAYGGGVQADILVGQSAGFTGGQASYSRDVHNGLEAYFAVVNRAGGIGGQAIKLVAEDDKGSKDQVLANTRKLIETDKVFALIGYTSGAGIEAALPMIEEARVPMLSPVTGNAGIRQEFHKYLFHTRAGYGDEMRKVVDTLALIGLQRFALVYLQDTTVNRKVMEEALAVNKVEAVVAVGLDRNAKTFDEPVASLVKANPQAVLFITNAPPLIQIVRGMKKRGYTGEFVSSSFAGTDFIADLKEDAPGLKVVQVLPPYGRTNVHVAREFREHLAALDSKAKPNYTSFEGYISARVLVEGLRRAGKSPSRERLVAALEGIRELDLGGYTVSFSPTSHDGSRFVDIGVVSRSSALVF